MFCNFCDVSKTIKYQEIREIPGAVAAWRVVLLKFIFKIEKNIT